MNYYHLIKVAHITGIFLLFLAMGGLIATDRRRPVVMTKYVILHGIALLILFLTGFAMTGVGQVGFPSWVVGKIVVWFLLGASLVVLRRGLLSPTRAWILITALGTASAYLAIARPGA